MMPKKEEGVVFFKVDFEKAYDSVSWQFLDLMMEKMGFNDKWRSWIRECLSSAAVSVLINGCPTEEFSISRGLRQGDPLSPFLFLIAAEGLNMIFKEACELGLYEGYKVGGLNLSHLQFVDDTLIFGEKCAKNIWAIKAIL